MRNLYYELADGTVVKTYKEALASGQTFKTKLETVPRQRWELSEKRKAMLVKLS